MPAPQMQRSVPEVLQDIIGNFEQIIRSEFRLAKTEMKEDAAKTAGPGATLGAGFLLALYGVGFLLLAAVYGLATVIAAWQAAAIVGVVLAVTGFALVGFGKKGLRRVNASPDKTIRSLEENVQWVKNQIR